ncbi:DMT family transporter [Pelistega indica]|nr:DMT family transporter [Pelistega indica]
MLLASFFFAGMGAAIKGSLEYGVSLPIVIFFRGLPSVICIAIWAMLTKNTLATQYPVAHLKRNVLGTTSMWFSFYALGQLPLATSTSLGYTSSLFIGLYVVFFSSQFHKDYPKLIAILLGFWGIVLVLKPSISEGQWFGAGAGMLAGLFSAFAMFQVKSLGKLGEPVWRTVFYFSCMVIFSGLVMMDYHELFQLSWQAYGLLVLAGLLGQFGQLAMTEAYGHGSAVIAAVLQYSTIIFSTILGMVFWNNVPDIIAWVGMATIIIAGILVVVIDQKLWLSEHIFKRTRSK